MKRHPQSRLCSAHLEAISGPGAERVTTNDQKLLSIPIFAQKHSPVQFYIYDLHNQYYIHYLKVLFGRKIA